MFPKAVDFWQAAGVTDHFNGNYTGQGDFTMGIYFQLSKVNWKNKSQLHYEDCQSPIEQSAYSNRTLNHLIENDN